MTGQEVRTVRVTVDPEVCLGSGTCIAFAPQLFEMGDAGAAHPLASIVEHNEQLDTAAARCPTGAIDITPL